jgi:hypothetical protein
MMRIYFKYEDPLFCILATASFWGIAAVMGIKRKGVKSALPSR